MRISGAGENVEDKACFRKKTGIVLDIFTVDDVKLRNSPRK